MQNAAGAETPKSGAALALESPPSWREEEASLYMVRDETSGRHIYISSDNNFPKGNSSTWILMAVVYF